MSEDELLAIVPEEFQKAIREAGVYRIHDVFGPRTPFLGDGTPLQGESYYLPGEVLLKDARCFTFSPPNKNNSDGTRVCTWISPNLKSAGAE